MRRRLRLLSSWLCAHGGRGIAPSRCLGQGRGTASRHGSAERGTNASWERHLHLRLHLRLHLGLHLARDATDEVRLGGSEERVLEGGACQHAAWLLRRARLLSVRVKGEW